MAHWYTLEIVYDGTDPGTTERRRLRNVSGEKLKKFREDVFFAGLYVPNPDRATEGEIISPYRLRKIFVFMQKDKINE